MLWTVSMMLKCQRFGERYKRIMILIEERILKLI